MKTKLTHLIIASLISLIFVTSSTSKAFAISDDVTQLQISNLTVASGEAYEVVENGLQNGSRVYINGAPRFSTVPTSLEGATYIMTARSDRRENDASFLTFDVNQDVTVYVGHDDSIGTKPSWLTSFTDTGDDIVTSNATLSIYASSFLAGTITLGGNGAPRRSSSEMYTVIVVGQGTGDEDLTSTATEDEDLTSIATEVEDLTSIATGDGTKGPRTSTATKDEDLKLFQSLDGNPVNTLSAEGLVLEQMIVNVNFDVLKKDRGHRYADSMLMDLFGQSLQVDKSRVDERSPSAYTWIGKVQGNPLSKVILTVGNNAMFGRIEYLDNVYKIEPIGDGTSHRIIKLDSTTTLPCGNDSLMNSLGVSSNAISSNLPPVSDQEFYVDSMIDIMILYTPGFAAQYPNNLITKINHMVDLANAAYSSSQISMRLNIVAMLEVPYPDVPQSLDALSDLTDDISIQGWRNQFGADVVTLLRDIQPNHTDGGRGWMMNNFNGYGWHNSHAYSVVNYNNTNHSDYTLAHEVGHNMGNAHDSANANVPGMYGYSYGYDDPWVFATIMGGNINTPRFGYFSNPNVTFPGVGSTGVHDSADNARSMRKTKETVSGFRPDTINRGSILDTSLITSGGVTQQLHFSDICGGGIPEISGVRLTFIEEIKPNTFTLEDIVHSTVSVSVYGNILSYTFNLDLTDVKVVSGSGNRQFDINFTPISPFLTGLVSVSLAIGPNIEDLNGNQLDLDLDGTYGETGDDRHIVSFGYDKGFDLPGVDCFGDRLTDAQLREIGKKIAEIMATIWDIDPGIETTDIITKDIIVIDNLAIDITTDFMDITTDFTTDTTINFQSSFLGY